MTVLAGLHCSHCVCLQKSLSICRGIQHVIGTLSNEATNNMGYRISELIAPTCLVWRSPCLALGGHVAPSIFAVQSLFADCLIFAW